MQYKNLEDGIIDRKIQEDEDNKAKAINGITSISEGEFIETAKKISDYKKKCGHFKKSERIYDTTHLPSVNEYLNVCGQVKLFINHMPQFMSLFDKKTSKLSPNYEYEKVSSCTNVGNLMMFIIVLEYYKKTGQPMPVSNKTAQDYFSRNMHLKDLALKCNLITDDRGLRLSMGLKYDPKDISFDSGISMWTASDPDISWGTIDWLYVSYNEEEAVEYFYPQLMVKDDHVEVNRLNN